MFIRAGISEFDTLQGQHPARIFLFGGWIMNIDKQLPCPDPNCDGRVIHTSIDSYHSSVRKEDDCLIVRGEMDGPFFERAEFVCIHCQQTWDADELAEAVGVSDVEFVGIQ